MKQDELINVKFEPPTLNQIIEYGTIKTEPMTHRECEKFHSYFESNGWMVGRVKMKSWKAALRHWQLNMRQGQSKEEARGKRTVFELKTIIEAKQKVANELQYRYANESATGLQWESSLHRAKHLQLKKQIKQLTEQLATL